jgi:uncharacterized protein with ACT and thioredoxin-like domain
MSSLLLACAMSTCFTPALASGKNHILEYCESVAKLNSIGVSASPGSVAGQEITRKAGQTRETHEIIWAIAKDSAIPVCRFMW